MWFLRKSIKFSKPSSMSFQKSSRNHLDTSWKVSVLGVILHFPAFRLNTERYSVSFRTQSEWGKLRTRITPNTDTFLRSEKHSEKQLVQSPCLRLGLKLTETILYLKQNFLCAFSVWSRKIFFRERPVSTSLKYGTLYHNCRKFGSFKRI